MRVAVIDKKDITIKVDRSTLKFNGESLPFGLMDILLINHRVNLSSRDILKLNEASIALLIISHNNKNISLLYSANTKNGGLRLAQYNALGYRLEFAKYFITQKIKTHIEHLSYFDKQLSMNNIMEEIEKCNSVDTLIGVEGIFAKNYFKEYFALFPKEFRPTKRTKNPPKDPVNAILSFWYSLYYNILTIKLLSVGFEPAIGYLHTPFRQHNALSSDFIEIFRAEINHAILGIFRNNLITKEDFKYRNGGVYLSFEGRKKVWREFVDLIEVLNTKLRAEIAHIRAMIEARENEKV
jgi:CRISPR-associated protein Cas1